MSECPALWFYSRSYGSGSEVWMRRQAEGMQHFGVHVVTNQLDSLSAEQSQVPLHVRAGKPKGRVHFQLSRIANVLTGIHPMERGEMSWLESIRNEFRPSAILCHYGWSATRIAQFAKLKNIPLFVHFNGYDLSAYLSHPPYRRRLEKILPHTSGLIVVARYMEDALLQLGAASDQINCIPYGVPLGDASNIHQRSPSSCRFLACGRLVEKKRPDLTILAFNECLKVAPDSTLTIVGNGPMLDQCQEIVDTLGISAAVTLLGLLPPEQVRSEMDKATVFVQHSVTGASGDKEGWPVAIAEAAAAGLPIISTRHASIPEQVIEGVTGLLVDERDWKSMGTAMAKLASDPVLALEMGRRSREHISAFDVAGQIKMLESFILSRCNARIL